MKKKLLAVLSVACLLLSACASGQTDYLVLVNKENKIDSKYIDTVELVKIKDYEGDDECSIEKKTCEAYKDLQKDLEKEGVIIGIDSVYRSVEEQQKIMDEFTEEYGEEYAKKTVAIPGTSEHHTGLAVDIVPKVNGKWIVENEDMMKEKEVFKTIHSKLADYGFIVRYPKGKEKITGYSYEPWHLRYVGPEDARKITEENETLEEYLGK